ncbi:MAG: hypothetical protein M2R45_05457 [Verrucomicrobia subdivision 3 bacterium]|nr:hypothetical protein [Limisphaerales bacterium]
MNPEFKEAVWRGNFKPTEDAYEMEGKVRGKFGLRARYDAARLFIGRSLAEPEEPPPVAPDVKYKTEISGERLFGEDIDLWLCALILDAGLGEGTSVEHLRPQIEAHWARGAALIRDDWEACEGDEASLIVRLATFLPQGGPPGPTSAPGNASLTDGEILVRLGSVSRTFDGDEPVDFCLNAPGNSPHLALMGRTRSGKTTTGMQMARSVVEQSGAPLLLIDPQGTFISEGELKFPDWPADIEAIEVAAEPIPLDFLPRPDVGRVRVQNAVARMRDSICQCCKTVGNLMQAQLFQAVESVIQQPEERGLPAIKKAYAQQLAEQGKEMDSIAARLDELTRLRYFEPQNTPAEFFRRSWVISLRQVDSEELKRLVMLLLLDATAMHFLAQADAPLHGGFRQMRQVLVIDEARKILKDRKSESSLVQLVTRSAAKGLSVMLLSQDPSDFEGHDYDFTTQLGAVISFCCNQTQRGLRSLQGAYGRKLQAAEFSDSNLEPGVAFAKLPGREPMRIKCWEPSASGQQ